MPQPQSTVGKNYPHRKIFIDYEIPFSELVKLHRFWMVTNDMCTHTDIYIYIKKEIVVTGRCNNIS